MFLVQLHKQGDWHTISKFPDIDQAMTSCGCLTTETSFRVLYEYPIGDVMCYTVVCEYLKETSDNSYLDWKIDGF